MAHPTPRITIARGDGIGPEIMEATLAILKAAGAQLELDEITLGEKAYLAGVKNGIPADAWEQIRKNAVLLKAPITTPQGGGYKSLNVTLRKALHLYANVRPTRAYAPFVRTNFPAMDLVVVRENEEDLYAGIEHQQTQGTVQALKLVSYEGSQAIIRYAFEYARANGRKKVTCLTKDNILKQTDGLFHKTFEEVAKEYPEIKTEHMIVDIGMARVAAKPESFDVIVTLNLYGDILSDIASEVAGSVGVSGSANIGPAAALFEAVHGSAPDIAGRGIANPSGLLNAAVMMLVHLGQTQVATKIQNAWLATLEDGIHTGDIFKEGVSKKKVGSAEFTQAVIERLGKSPKQLKAVEFHPSTPAQIKIPPQAILERKIVGVDVFVKADPAQTHPVALGEKLKGLGTTSLTLASVANRGIQVFPPISDQVACGDLWRAQFMAAGSVTNKQILELLGKLDDAGVEFVQVQQLCEFGGKKAFSANQGE